MAEALTRSSIETSDERERRELFARMDELQAFVEGGTASRLLLLELKAGLQGLLKEEEDAPDEPIVPELLPEPEEIPAEEEGAAPDVSEHPIEVVETEKKPTMTFERARQMDSPLLSDEFILDALSGDLQKPGGERAFFVKSYLDNVPADASDKEYATTNSEVVQLHDELADFVASELKIYTPPAYHSHMEDRKRVFFTRLEQGKQAFRKYVKGREERKDLNENKTPHYALKFHGLNVMTEGGKDVDLLETGVKDIHVNLYAQREIMGTFMHWSSDEYMQKKASGDKPKLTRRIYLNPRPQDSVKVFSDVVHAVEAAGLAAKGKIYDRVTDSLVMKRYDSVGDEYDTRGDGIVLYAASDEADQLLKVMEDVYRAHEASFAGRGLSSVPFEIEPGFGIGDEPTYPGSLTSHRSDVLEKVLKAVRESGETEPSAQVQLFRRLWQAEAALENINANNPAFNDH